MVKAFPLPLDFWRPAKLTDAQNSYFVKFAKHMVLLATNDHPQGKNGIPQQEVEETFSSQDENSIHWKFLYDKFGISLFREDSKDCSIPEYRGVGKITATIDDTMDMMICETTHEYRKMSQKFYDNFLDCAVIHTIIPRTEKHPNRYMGVKWLALKSPSGFHHRDYCFLEYIDICKNKLGNTAGFRVIQSISLDEVPSLESTHDLVRGEILKEAHIFSNTRLRGVLRVSHTVKMNAKGIFPSLLNNKLMENLALNIVRMEDYIENERIKQMHFADQQDLVPECDGDICNICSRDFTTFRRSYNCVICGQLLCSKCCSMKVFDLPIIGEKKIRVCHTCVLRSRQDAEQRSGKQQESVDEKPLNENHVSQLLSTALGEQLSLESQRLMSHGSFKKEIIYDGIYSTICLKVVVTGSWCNWRTDTDFGAVALKRESENRWVTTLHLSPGVYYYKFLIDGYIWTHETISGKHQGIVDDGEGSFNRSVVVGYSSTIDNVGKKSEN